jgi:prepilin-type N-terminal cleavage/methylation domain-containing protein
VKNLSLETGWHSTTTRAGRVRRNGRLDPGFTLVEILIAIVLVGVLSAVAVVGISGLVRTGSAASCNTSLDAARTGSNVYFTGSNAFPTTLLQMTSASSPSLQLASNVRLDVAGTSASGPGWTLTMTPGVGAAAPTFACANDGAVVAVTSTTTAPNGTGACPGSFVKWVGEYYANQNLTGTPALCRDDPAIAFNWASNGPGGTLPIWRFSARWTRTAPFTAGAHVFTLSSDDGSRLYVDGVLIIDWWSDHSPTVRTATTTLAAGDHTVVLEYYQYYGTAQVSLVWS